MLLMVRISQVEKFCFINIPSEYVNNHFGDHLLSIKIVVFTLITDIFVFRQLYLFLDLILGLI